ncbi:hypothetical protein L226DRAFT_266909 [Lentinus tigrinus ALCF2SS1-7]|uniref:uncharacterized protein n=1 Tax=Lentinus tigrinus ALCF2SS1-7 TaxID=1328758 RepID=UPI0011660624|nr:hypothetical protein L226DRAFT_266909 [Lentinus tigrinus ALCF2SS1-7]
MYQSGLGASCSALRRHVDDPWIFCGPVLSANPFAAAASTEPASPPLSRASVPSTVASSVVHCDAESLSFPGLGSQDHIPLSSVNMVGLRALLWNHWMMHGRARSLMVDVLLIRSRSCRHWTQSSTRPALSNENKLHHLVQNVTTLKIPQPRSVNWLRHDSEDDDDVADVAYCTSLTPQAWRSDALQV